jgi:hypothetical protein
VATEWAGHDDEIEEASRLYRKRYLIFRVTRGLDPRVHVLAPLLQSEEWIAG